MANKKTVTKEIDQPFHAQNSTTKQLKEFLKERGVQVSGTRSCLLKESKDCYCLKPESRGQRKGVLTLKKIQRDF